MRYKTLGKNATKFDPNKIYLCSIKYDGFLVKIHQEGGTTRFFTSDDKEFALAYKAPYGFYTAFAELVYKSEGKLGDRTKSAIITTWRTEFNKHKKIFSLDDVSLQVYDMYFHEQPQMPYASRVSRAKELGLPFVQLLPRTGADAIAYANSLCDDGWEGLIIRDPDGLFEPGKQVHHSIKIKNRPTADLECIGVEIGEGKCNGIGALILQDSEGRIVKVGSGLPYDSNSRTLDIYTGNIVEISYEQLLDTYIQPVFIRIRDDKTKEEID